MITRVLHDQANKKGEAPLFAKKERMLFSLFSWPFHRRSCTDL